MAKNKSQHTRLLFIDRQIRDKRFPNCASLAAEWEVSTVTIQRDLDYMRYQLDAPLAYSARHRGFYYTEEQYQLPAMQIRESDLFALYLADKLLKQYEGTPVYDNLCSVFRKIEESLPEKVPFKPADEQTLFTVFPPFTTVIQPAVMATVFDCLRASTRMTIEYTSPGGEPVQRQVDPYQGVRFEGDWYVVGWCHLRQAIRTFSLARITVAQPLPERFIRPADFDFSKLSGSHFGLHWGTADIRVRIRFTRETACFIRERQWHASQIIEDEPDGGLILTLVVNHLLELRRWILSWGDGAQVLEPPELAASLQAVTGQMAAMYAGKGQEGCCHPAPVSSRLS